jgi:putative acetyltransferase
VTPRPVTDADAQDLFGLMALCFAEYPGCFVDPHEDLPDLLKPTSWLTSREGAFWVVEDMTGRIKASMAVDRPEADIGELHRLYVRPDARGEGLAKALVTMAEDWAIAHGATRIIAWSDTRFTKAHALYEKRGYQRQPGMRALNDVSHSSEFCFVKDVSAAA